MTIDEAIKELEEFQDFDYAQRNEKLSKALKMGVGALQDIAQMRLLDISPISELLPEETVK